MFRLSEIEHTFRLPPHRLDRPLAEAIKGELESLFVDKVIAYLGLCISIYDIRSIDGGFVFPGDGASTYTVKFRLIIFCPFVGEVIAGRLIDSTDEGLKLSLGFFDDIHVPVSKLPQGSCSETDPDNKGKVRWMWNYGDGQKFPIDNLDEIRLRVHDVRYPKVPLEQESSSKNEEESSSKNEEESSSKNEQKSRSKKPFAPMEIMGFLDCDGLGPISWWV
ncbi:OLC1v1007141C1 [Oldenlandia corymbosa var. corymbosa]|uniref:DNA-directed RNA polymerase subunit n=1 Tax=Oldenlandia corymbosa var. corymbosa TaxID=529605 RepID=A0AAV1DL93_OLDCO|nr:OLC1v1007141C1 [Oldenlandia corymbosa var. corymbosa]